MPIATRLDVEQKEGHVTEGSCPGGSVISDKAKEVVMGQVPEGLLAHWKDFRFYSGRELKLLEGCQAGSGMICLQLWENHSGCFVENRIKGSNSGSKDPIRRCIPHTVF